MRLRARVGAPRRRARPPWREVTTARSSIWRGRKTATMERRRGQRCRRPPTRRVTGEDIEAGRSVGASGDEIEAGHRCVGLEGNEMEARRWRSRRRGR
ncbi:hypothetical protein E2562_009458 [Oryza meyeriana var. granulata]|uniref:DUF834 domain-containing protein n=1 Tax=Oryza meyeriana var. granulata TaxID=110450 RepID=A0A6G1BTY3_9ORYZ|nr:hypothetical protein E2562_009458 [Oryza meyeriana var. granulata]